MTQRPPKNKAYGQLHGGGGALRERRPAQFLWTAAVLCLVSCDEEASPGRGQVHQATAAEAAGAGGSEHPTAPACPTMRVEKHPFGSKDGPLTELSGLVASRDHDGLLWSHNDSGDGAILYAVDRNGKPRGRVELPVSAEDWEDIAIAPRAGRDYLYVADTGDNFSTRESGVSIHRILEPTPPELDAAGDAPLRAKVETMKLTYPEGPEDAEALLVDPEVGRLYVVTKPRLAPPNVYSFAFSPQGVARYEGTMTPRSAGSPVALVTGADTSPDGFWIAVRTYVDVFLFPRRPSTSFAQALLGPGCRFDGPPEPQGESVAFLPAGFWPKKPSRASTWTLATVSEGAFAPLYLLRFDEEGPAAEIPLR